MDNEIGYFTFFTLSEKELVVIATSSFVFLKKLVNSISIEESNLLFV